MCLELELDGVGDPKPPFRWSFSQWENYNTCPQKWKFQSILKLPRQPPGPAAARGLDMHDRAEKYIKREIDLEECVHGDPTLMFGDKKPAVIHSKYIPILDAFRDHRGFAMHTERKGAFTRDWQLTAPTDKFASAIVVLDAVRVGGDRYDKEDDHVGVCSVAEWKSGKPKDSHSEQRSLYAAYAWKHWVQPITRVTTYYLEDTAPPQRLTVKSEEGFENIRVKWQQRIDEMQTNSICAPRPGFHCNWCDYSKKKGGPCQF